jgi:uncharacterized protein YbjT (DUF2867 family)/uncharacterized protein YndB with AHSA1/START domain
MPETTGKLIMVTGATGYIASRLIPRLLERGYQVRCLVRRPNALNGRPWSGQVQVVTGEITDPLGLQQALSGVWTAYYLIHHMSSGRGYTTLELEGAQNFASAAEQAAVKHIIYLGGLADPEASIAAHLRSRIETGQVLRCGSVPVTEFRAGVIIGAGSISFEMIRFMTELLPLVPGPVWVRNRSQPIAIQNVLDYLLEALVQPNGHGRVFEIGGPQVMQYSELMLEYARLRGLKRRLLTLPYVPLWFMSTGIGLFSPVERRIAHALVDGMRSDSWVNEAEALQVFPHVKLITYEEAVRACLARLHPDLLEPVWRDSRKGAVQLKHEGFFISHRSSHVAAPPERVFAVVQDLGRKGDWLYANPLWRLRRWIDSFFTKRSAQELKDGSLPGIGDRVDFYQVEDLQPGTRLLLHSQLKAPGEGWMEWRVEPEPGGRSRLAQTGYFAPRGLPGFLYWYLLYPAHELVFRGMLRAIAKKAEGRK